MFYISILIAGFGGGAVRGLVGYLKNSLSYKNPNFDLPYFFGMAFLSGIIGLLVSAAIYETGTDFLSASFVSPAIAFIVGYAGGDFVEGVYKILMKHK
ncbi:MAG: hypothetical protein Q8N69_03465 [bacterium]|nr:hypothetical protein [bacterium]